MDVDRIKALADRLEKYPPIHALGRAGDPGGWRVAYSITEIEEAAQKMVQTLIPAIEADNDLDELQTALIELMEELRHLVYHVNDSGLFGERLISPFDPHE